MLHRTLVNSQKRSTLLKAFTYNTSPVIFNLYRSSPVALQYYRSYSTNKDDKSDTKIEVPSKQVEPTNVGKVDKPKDQGNKMQKIWLAVKEGVAHFWDGTKLLALEIKISTHLLVKYSTGHELTRREMLQLKRTTTDVVRLVPFSAFVIIPFAELLLPVALKIFPNLLPSTYETSKDKEKKLMGLKKTRTLVSDIITNAKTMNHFKPDDISNEQKVLFNSFYLHVRKTGKPESIGQLIKVAQLYKDDVVLDNLTRSHLVAMAKYINIQPFGTDVMLRYRIRYKMLQLKNDDKQIHYEGLSSLNSTELRLACMNRGIRTVNQTDVDLRENLKIWLDLRLKEKIPSTLLLLAVAHNYGDLTTNTASLYDSLCYVLQAIPDELYHEVKVNVIKQDDDSKAKLRQLKEQENLMADEVEQEKSTIVKIRDDLNLDEEKKEALKEIPEKEDSTKEIPEKEDATKEIPEKK
ncbi:related to LETM1 domain-containing protein YLH47, mitochondrial [Hanseniaspora guilliermondii]|uniref:Related to LETM1 domain-containing protein YLH47, mitochondrial n=1 Tax=Hanseniaspora guilliermondii TaxID=56406 RepID=A0A1L0B2G3_9ASCO|nr:related to LETM1 domain-containing protein YLH47, mitochondrial [Hanseniaspora guilliermondii]